MAKPEKGTIQLGTSFSLPESWVRRGFRGFTPESVASVYSSDLTQLSERTLKKMLEQSPWEDNPARLNSHERMTRCAKIFQEKVGTPDRIAQTHQPVWHHLLKKVASRRQIGGVADVGSFSITRLTNFFMSTTLIPHQDRQSLAKPEWMFPSFFERYISAVPHIPMSEYFLPQWGAFLYAQAYPIVTDAQNNGRASAFKNDPKVHGHEAQTLAGSCPATPLVRSYFMGWGQVLAESGIRIFPDGTLVLPPRLR